MASPKRVCVCDAEAHLLQCLSQSNELLLCCDADAVMKTEEMIHVCVQKTAETARAQLEEVVCAVVHIDATSEKLLFTKNSSCAYECKRFTSGSVSAEGNLGE